MVVAATCTPEQDPLPDRTKEPLEKAPDMIALPRTPGVPEKYRSGATLPSVPAPSRQPAPGQPSAVVVVVGASVVAVVSPQGELLREVGLRGAKPTNVAFGGADGRDVYVTLQDRGAIETFRSDRPGREYGR